MKKITKALSVFLAFVFVFSGAVVLLPSVSLAANYTNRYDENGNLKINYMAKEYYSDDEKLADMTKYKVQNGYEIYVEEYTGEVAFRDAETGEAIFTNPYDLAVPGNANSKSIKEQLFSQIMLVYEDNKEQKPTTMWSFVEAAQRNQITFKNIKNGVRVEYAIGEIQPTRLFPRRISKERFETMILAHITNDHDRERLLSFYQLFDSSDKTLTETQAKVIEAKFPITRRMPIYVCSTDITNNEKKELERIIKAYCSEFYTLDDMEEDHSETGYDAVEVAPACFRMALEYTIGEDGLSVRLPANGIRFDESNYTLKTISILPFMGCGNTNNDGYTFIPDGSGAIIEYKDIANSSSTISGQIYGADYAYITLNEDQNAHGEVMRYPVFGNVRTSRSTPVDPDNAGDGKTGFVAIITEGDSMAQIVARAEGLLHKYSYVYATFTPRPSDKYSLTSSVENASGAQYTIPSKRKYSGSYVIKYMLLSGRKKATGNNYECSYVGMAKAYRDYLMSEGVLERKTLSATDMPLYIETFGSLKAQSTFLSFPITVDKELTTFDDVKEMYDDLSERGIGNIRFKLTGYANGGLDSTYPAKVKWVSALGGSSGFEDLASYSAEKGFGIYPDFDFAYVASTGFFDGFSEKTDAVRTIDGRYTTRKYYDSASQTLVNDTALAVSPSKYPYFSDKFIESYSEYGLNSVSVSTLGTTLNSDFDEDDPYNREDSKKFTTELIEKLDETYGDIMVDGGNAYSLAWADHIVGVPTDSSNYLSVSRSVPFSGFVLHGFVNFCGNALNMEGDVDHALLKAVENGASLYFKLAYENINELKESKTYNKYFSVGYEVWRDEIVAKYNKVNELMKDLSSSLLDSHGYVSGYRLPSASDLANDAKDREEQQAEIDRQLEEQAAREELDRKLAERKGVTYTPPRSITQKVTDYTVTAPDGTVYSTDPKYVTEDGTIVRETYDNGVEILINYNSFDVIIVSEDETVTIGALSFVRR